MLGHHQGVDATLFSWVCCRYRCEFSGSKTELNDHLVHCSFEGVKVCTCLLVDWNSHPFYLQIQGFLLRLDRTMNELQQDIKNKDEKCSQLGELVSELRDKLERTEIQSTISSKRVGEESQGKQAIQHYH